MTTLKSGQYIVPETWNSATNGRWVLGTDSQTGKPVFIKEFRGKRYVENPEGYENLRRANERTEAYRQLTERINAAVGQIAGRGGDVVVTTDFFRDGVSLYKVNEKIDFMPWEPSEVHEHLSVSQIDTLMLRLVNAISALHGANLLHCDLKPENVFIVEQDGTYVGMISDFDDSFFMNALPSKDDVVGTPEYMSPELAAYKMGDEDEPIEGLPLGPASDMFSVGLIYHMYLTGEMPHFDTDRYDGQLFSVMFDGGEYTLSEKLDAAHYTLIQRLLIPDPALRMNSCAAVASEINNIRRQYDKEYQLTLMSGGRPLANCTVTLYGTYPIGSGTNTDQITEPVQHVRTDSHGRVVLKGLLPEMPLSIECGEELKPITWRGSGSTKECTISVSSSIDFSIHVLCDGHPIPSKKVTLYRQADSGYQRLDERTTDVKGKVSYRDLPDGRYDMECDGVKVPVTWDNNHGFVYHMKTYRIRVTQGGQPASDKQVSLFLYRKPGNRPVKAGKTDRRGELEFCFAANNKRWRVSCGGQEEEFVWPPDGIYEMKLTPGVQVILTAQLLDSTTPIQDVCMAVAQKSNGKIKVIKKTRTNAKGQADMGCFDPGEYYIAVLSAPDGYIPSGQKFKQPRRVVLPDGRERIQGKIKFRKEVVLEDQENIVSDIPISTADSNTWCRLVYYRDGSVLLVGLNGSTKKLKSDRQLGLYGLEQYKQK